MKGYATIPTDLLDNPALPDCPTAKAVYLALCATNDGASGIVSPNRLSGALGITASVYGDAIDLLTAADVVQPLAGGWLWLLPVATWSVQSEGWFAKALREVIAVGGYELGARWLHHNRYQLQSIRPKRDPDCFADVWHAIRADQPLPAPWPNAPLARAGASELNPNPNQKNPREKQASKQASERAPVRARERARERIPAPVHVRAREEAPAPALVTSVDEAVRHLLMVDGADGPVRQVFDAWCAALSPMPSPSFRAVSWQIAQAVQVCIEADWAPVDTLTAILAFCARSGWRKWTNGVDGLTRADALFGVKHGAGRDGNRDASSTVNRLRLEAASWKPTTAPVDDPEAVALIPQVIADGKAQTEADARAFLASQGWKIGAQAA